MPDVTDLIGGVILFLALSVPIAAFYLRADSCKRAAPPRKGRDMNLKRILADHKAWLAGDGGRRANLRGANLTGANLTGANLTGADIFNLRGRGAIV